jgi:aryl-alcohol dehydrogenase-like predicted oxidoreductase
MADRRVTRRDFVQHTTRFTAAAAVAAGVVPAGARAEEVPPEVKSTRSYNPDMEYRRLGKTGLWVSAVCLGGHWKRVDKVIGATGVIDPYEGPRRDGDQGPFLRNRDEVVSRCLDVGINCIDFAGNAEPTTYCKVLGPRRDKMYLCYSHPASELRVPENCNANKLVELFAAGLKRCRLEYADVWRLMAMERGSRHSQADVEAMVEALEIARRKGLCRFTGFSTHDRRWAKKLIETYPDVLQVLCTPYTAKSKVLPEDSLFDAVARHDVGVLGIKPFASNAIFQGDGSPDSPHAKRDDRRARVTIRYILSNRAIAAPIPGLISARQVDNMALAVKERRELDFADRMELEQICDEMWARLPASYAWLKEWEYV